MPGLSTAKVENIDLKDKGASHGNPVTEEFPTKLIIRRKTMNRHKDSKIIWIVHPVCLASVLIIDYRLNPAF
jgi:hypothetical protein